MDSRGARTDRLSRRWTVGLVHHAHTDIGYTEVQNRIVRRHVDFLDQALELIRRRDARDAGLAGFTWNSECFWSIEQWLAATPAARHGELAAAIRSGALGLSGTYQHFTELIDDHTVRQMLGRATAYARSIGAPLDTAISADVNGFGWGYAQALHDAGIRTLLVCLHAHHGRSPLARTPQPFHWITPRGDRLLVWLGEHYMFGNMLGLAPGAVLTYSFTDEFQTKPVDARQGQIAEIRLPRYLAQLEAAGYPAAFVPLHVSGLVTDNSPPSDRIIRFVHAWNARHGDRIRLEMMTASAVGARLRAAFPTLPDHAGDWPDWWSDGVGSAPAATRLCRQAQRDYRYRRALAERFALPVPPGEARRIEDAIAHYCEHTFGHCHSVHTPWNLTARALEAGKAAYASTALQLADDSLDAAFRQLGEAPAGPDRGFVYRVINPLDVPVRDVARLALDSFEFGRRDVAARVVDVATGRELPCQMSPAPHGLDFAVRVDLPPGGTLDLELREAENPPAAAAPAPVLTPAGRHRVETACLRLEVDPAQGIVAWTDVRTGQTLLRGDAPCAPFTPIAELTPVPLPVSGDALAANPYVTTRTALGLNRRGPHARESIGRLLRVQPHDCGALRQGIELTYGLDGCAFFHVFVAAWADLPRVDVTLRLHKQSHWEPENLYVALPFAPGGDLERELWVEKAGALVRPGRDQLPQSLLDFHCVQDGFTLPGAGLGLAVATPDAPLLHFGPLVHGPRPLMGDSPSTGPTPRLHGWLMNNFWETNFTASLAGFHEFTYRLEWGPGIATAEAGIQLCRALNHGLKNFRLRASAPRSAA